ncbi:MAG: DNA repair protein RecO [Clostridiales bacterium]|nr:DNA repair protein RecO [Clostridiales bacterium]
MPPILLRALLADATDYRENSRMVTLLTAERGCISACAHNSRKAGAALLAATQPLVCGEYELHESRGRYTLRNCEITETFFPLRGSAEKYRIALAITAITRAAAPEGLHCENIFHLLLVTLSHLAYSQQHHEDILIYFLAHFYHLAGHSPILTQCAACQTDLRGTARLYFSPEQGGAVCGNCARLATPTTPTTLEALRRVLLLPESDIPKVVLKPELRAQILRLLIAYGQKNGIGPERGYLLLVNS